MAEDESLILVEKVGENMDIALLTLNRQNKLNALNDDMLNLLKKKFKSFKNDSSVRAVIIFSEGKSWCVGLDLKWIVKLSWRFTKAIRMGQKTFSIVEKNHTPVIAAINGYTFGGGMELALSCDLRISSDKASFGQTETTLGLPPGWGGTYRLPKIVGLSLAKELILTGRKFDAEEALKIGLVSDIVPEEKLKGKAIEIAESIAKNAPLAVKEAKKAIKKGIHRSTKIGYFAELKGIIRCFRTKDIREGFTAIFEKRKPEFKGK